jgi:flagellin-specific chaperone FliS
MLVNLRDGNVEKDCEKLKDVLGIITGLREAWEGALVSVRQIKYGK